MIRALLPWLLGGLLLSTATLSAQETLSSVQRDLDRVAKEIDREKELHKQERKRAADFEVQKAEKLSALQNQIKVSQGRIDSLTREADKARRQKSNYRGQAQFFSNKTQAFRLALSASIKSVATELLRDFPYHREKRVSDWEDLAKSLEAGTVTPDDALNRLSGLIQASLDPARDVEVYSGVYSAVGGGNFEGYYVRLGTAMLAFASEDGKMAALLGKEGENYTWQDQKLSAGIKAHIAEAIRVAQGKEAPKLVAMPIVVSGANSFTESATDKELVKTDSVKTPAKSGAKP